MTNIDAIKQLVSIKEYFEDRIEKENDPAFDKDTAKEDAEAMKMAIKALEQELILDKIRAEIEEIEKDYGFDKATKYGNKNAEQQNLSYSTMHFYEIADIFDDIKEIIDKYRESEVQDADCN